MGSEHSSYENFTHGDHNSKPMEGVFHSHLEEKVRPYIDLIDSLRLIGVDKDLALPTIAVIGDQSSGKSSVLEALSGVALPRGSAQNELAGEGVGICDELITLEIMAPDVCDLTLIDLPGIARIPVKGQPEDIGQQINRLIRKYIEKDQTINLVVVPCNVDIATTEALKMAEEVDPEGKRTLAILTKPDLIDKGTEKNILDIVRNQVIPLSKGYIIVKCRGQKQIDEKISLTEATRLEREFFRRHEYFSCLWNEEKATVQCLATKLTHDLVDHIKKSLPLISEEIKKKLWSLRKELSQCESGPPLDPQKRKLFFIDTLTKFNDKINRLASGDVVNDDNLFVTLRSEFKKWKNLLDNTKGSFYKTIQKAVAEYNKKHRGRELPGFCEYKMFEMGVQKLVIKLQGPAIDTLKVIRGTIQKQFSDVSKTCFPNYPYLQSVAMNKIDNIQSKQEAKVEERIREQFEMEQLVYTQDGIYFKTLNDMHAADRQKALEDKFAWFDSINKYPEMLRAYFENKIDNIQSKQEAKVEERICEQFEMEQLVYTQDGIYFKTLNDIHAPDGQKASEDNFAGFDSRNKYPEMLRAYYEIVVQRLADQVPMLIRYFMLKESAQLLCSEMLGLMDGANVAEALREDSDISRRRIDMQTRVDRLTLAQEKLSNFL
ncbi:hypothetical protein KOW79_020613 [Hemibagrus wyckioides]|uniref:Uncharacterized protein n=1 Tax=Hemibagrus wyckioides TaxID=337641 RepID=A0A9D3N4T2_9TELE|nr:hypothetical protein KOW79_020613 [Hemibagrus wyckioides]